MNFYLTRAFAKKLKDEHNNKKPKQLQRNDVSGTNLPTTPNGNGKTVYSTIFKWLRG